MALPEHAGAVVVQTMGPAGAVNPLVNARSPGPIYLPRYRGVSTMRTLPSVVFPAAPRHPPTKADAVPGPGAYVLDDSLSKRCAALRGREKFGSSAMTSAVFVPGPGEYPRAETHQTRKRNAPMFSIKGRRPALPPAFSVPAPNAHQPAEPFNKVQHVAKLRNAPRVHLGPPPRRRRAASDGAVPSASAPGAEADTPRIVTGTGAAPPIARNSHQRDAAALAHATPGPSEYAVERGFHQLSTLQRVPAFSIVPRRPAPARNAGMHVTPDFHDAMEGMGPQPLSHKRTAPSVSFSGRVKFGSVY